MFHLFVHVLLYNDYNILWVKILHGYYFVTSLLLQQLQSDFNSANNLCRAKLCLLFMHLLYFHHSKYHARFIKKTPTRATYVIVIRIQLQCLSIFIIGIQKELLLYGDSQNCEKKRKRSKRNIFSYSEVNVEFVQNKLNKLSFLTAFKKGDGSEIDCICYMFVTR